MSFKLHIFTHDQDNVQIPSIVSIIVYNMYLEASEMCVWGVTTSLTPSYGEGYEGFKDIIIDSWHSFEIQFINLLCSKLA